MARALSTSTPPSGQKCWCLSAVLCTPLLPGAPVWLLVHIVRTVPTASSQINTTPSKRRVLGRGLLRRFGPTTPSNTLSCLFCMLAVISRTARWHVQARLPSRGLLELARTREALRMLSYVRMTFIFFRAGGVGLRLCAMHVTPTCATKLAAALHLSLARQTALRTDLMKPAHAAFVSGIVSRRHGPLTARNE